MNETFQTGLHPDADQLAAFAEQALPLHEREQTLAHLAACSDCRQIVFLAQAAAPEEVAQIAPATVRRPWFSGWNLLWPAVAALAGIVGFSVYLGRVRVTNRAAQDVTAATVSAPQPPPAAAMPKPIAPAEPALQKPEMRGAIDTALAPPPKPAQPAVIAALPAEDSATPVAPPKLPAPPQGAPARPAAVGGVVRDGAPLTVDGLANLPIEGRNTVALAGKAQGAAAGTGRTAVHGTTPSPAQQQFQNYVAAPKPMTAAAPTLAAPPPPPAPASPPPTQFAQNKSLQNDQLRQTGQANQTVNVEANAAAVQLDTATLASALSSIVPVLPSHLETISSTSNGSDLLAVDSGGSVFLSHDEGKHWKGVSAAWAGRPVKVELAAPGTPDSRVSGLLKKAPPTVQDASAASGNVMAGEALASPGGAQLHGVITDPTGASIPGAQVRVQASGATVSTSMQTDAAGRFQAAGLPPGKYEVTITSPGFATLVRTVELDARTPMGFTAVLPVGAAAETVTVESASDGPAAKRMKTPKLAGFQLTTDTGVVWVSSDGRNWKRR